MALSTSVPAGGGSLSGFVLSLMGITEGGYQYTEYLLALESQQADGCPSLTPTPQLVSPHCYQAYICIQTRGLWSTYGMDCWQAFALDLAGAALCRRASTQTWCGSTSGLSCSEGHWCVHFIRPLQLRCTPALLAWSPSLNQIGGG